MDDKTKAGLLGDIEYFSAKLEADSTSMLFLPLAKAYVELSRFDDAVPVLLRGLDANPDVPTAKTMLAQSYIGMGRVDEAKGLLTEIRVLDPNNYIAEKLLGKIYHSENEYKKAILSYKNAYFSAPEDAELKELIEELLSETGMEFSDLRDERKLMEDDELLDTIGQELADEVKNEIGDAADKPNLTDEEVKSTVDDIVGHSLDFEEDSLDQFAEDDSPADTTDEIESEMLAEAEQDVTPTESLDTVVEAEKLREKNFFAGVDEPSDGSVPAEHLDELAAELSADFGLEGIKSEAEAFADDEEYDIPAIEDEAAIEAAEEEENSGQSVFDDFGDFEEVPDEHLASIDDMFSFVPVSEDGKEVESPAPSEPEAVEEMPEEASSDEPEELNEIDSEEQLAEIGAEEPVAEEPIDETEALLAQVAAEKEAEAQAEEPVAEEHIDETEALLAQVAAEKEAEAQVEEPVAEEPIDETEALLAQVAAEKEAEAQAEEPVAEEPMDETEALLAQVAAEKEAEAQAEEPVAEEPIDETEALLAQVAAEKELEEQPAAPDEIIDNVITDEKIYDALKDVLGDSREEEALAEPEPENITVETFDDAVEGEIAESADEIISHHEPDSTVIDVQEAEGVADSPDDVIDTLEETGEIPEDILAEEPAMVAEIQEEIAKESELNDELATLFALDEIEERDRGDASDEYVSMDADDVDGRQLVYSADELDSETYEQVNKLENLLELIKNNSK
jgi:tetratricopeptide (TPR) repeat protein